jgi:hypothetical protein
MRLTHIVTRLLQCLGFIIDYAIWCVKQKNNDMRFDNRIPYDIASVSIVGQTVRKLAD